MDPAFQKKLKDGNKAFDKLLFVVVICFLFMIVEVIGGVIAGSLAIKTDAAHMFSDVGGFAISMISIWIGQKAHTNGNTYGYHRAEVLGALTSILVIWAIIAWLIFEATAEIYNGTAHIDQPLVMLITAFISLACNIFNLIALGHFPCMPAKEGAEGNFMDSVTSIYKPHGGHTCSHGHSHGGANHGHSHGASSASHGHAHDDEAPERPAELSHIQSIVSQAPASEAEILETASDSTEANKLLSGLGGLKTNTAPNAVLPVVDSHH